jgi:hypothetical protein
MLIFNVMMQTLASVHIYGQLRAIIPTREIDATQAKSYFGEKI